MSLTITSVAPEWKASASSPALSEALFSSTSPKMDSREEERLLFPADVVDPAALGPTHTIACQKDLTPLAIAEAQSETDSELKPPEKAPCKILMLAMAVTGRLDTADIAVDA